MTTTKVRLEERLLPSLPRDPGSHATPRGARETRETALAEFPWSETQGKEQEKEERGDGNLGSSPRNFERPSQRTRGTKKKKKTDSFFLNGSMLLRAHQCVLPARRLAWRRLRRSNGGTIFVKQRSSLPSSTLLVTLTRASSTFPEAAASSPTHAADASSSSSSPSSPPPPPPADESPKLAKRKLALHIGYIGTSYRGMGKWRKKGENRLDRRFFF